MMGMIKCKECGKEISSKAEFCPNCGAKRNNTSLFTVRNLILFLIFITVFIIARSTPSSTSENKSDIKILTEQQKHNKEKIIVQKLKNIPSSEIFTNLRMYKELHNLFPLNSKYNNKIAYYTKKLSELEKRIGKIPTVNPFDGVPYVVDRYIKSIAKDPDSVKFDGCTELRYSYKGWFTTCKVRAKNSFGGYVLNHYVFMIKHNTVVDAKSIN